MNQLTARIAEYIRNHGPITFEQYMTMALYDPDLGYYTRGAADIGKAADFYTSTNMNALFGALVAEQAAEIWDLMGRPADFVFTEQGGGRGLLALDFLNEMKERRPDCYGNLRYHMVEISAAMKDRQRSLLTGHEDKVFWFDTLTELPVFSGILFSNELVDAFPVHVVQFAPNGLMELYVGEAGGILREEIGPCSSDELPSHFRSLGISMPAGYRTEINLNAKRWSREIAARIRTGYVITVDYGFNSWDYYSGERSTGTLVCYHGHTLNEAPLDRPGEQDITAHVDFSFLVEWGRQEGLIPCGYVTQSTFLLNMGIDRRMDELHKTLTESEYLSVAAQVRTLLMPSAMGETHKILIQRKGAFERELKALRLRNRLDYLIAAKP